jgi:hypothetical protein
MAMNALPVPIETTATAPAAADTVRKALARLGSIAGLVTACLVEPDSAQVLDAVVFETGAGAVPADRSGATVAAAASDVIQVIGLMTTSMGEPEDLEEVIITLGKHHHLITPLPSAGADGLLIVVMLDRARTNLALARQQLRALGPLLEPTGETSRVS